MADCTLGAFSHWVQQCTGFPGRAWHSTAARNEHVAQVGETDCGVACAAMLASVSYAAAKRAIFGRRRKRVFYTSYRDIRRALDHFGIEYELLKRPRRFTRWADLRGVALVAIESTPVTKNHWHWVVFDSTGGRRRVRDPAQPGIERFDFRGMRGRSYLRVG